MSFDEKYRIVDLAEDAITKTYVAREKSTGREVTIFVFAGKHAPAEAEVIGRLSASDRSTLPEFIETGSDQGIPYVITEPLGGYADLKRRVLQTRTPLPEPASGEFTRMFQSPAALIHEPIPKTVPDSIPVQKPAAPPAPEPAPGEFTRMFQSPAALIDEAIPKTVPDSAPVRKSAPVPPAPEPAPGEFTKLFSRAPIPLESVDVPSKSATAGEFTQIFRGGTVDPPLASAPSPLESTSFFSSPPVEAPTASATPEAVSSPGEYTRIFGAQPEALEEEPVPAPAVNIDSEPSLPARQDTKLIPIFIGICVLLLMVILFLLIRK